MKERHGEEEKHERNQREGEKGIGGDEGDETWLRNRRAGALVAAYAVAAFFVGFVLATESCGVVQPALIGLLVLAGPAGGWAGRLIPAVLLGVLVGAAGALGIIAALNDGSFDALTVAMEGSLAALVCAMAAGLAALLLPAPRRAVTTSNQAPPSDRSGGTPAP